MPQLYLVKTTFKAGGVVFLAGDLVEEQDLAGIRLVKIRLNEGKLIPLPEEGQVLDTMTLFFEQRYGIDLKARIAERASKGSNSAENPNPSASDIPPTGTPQEPPVKPVVTPKAILPTKPQPLSKSPVTNTVKK
jgi:hypothetical protein